MVVEYEWGDGQDGQHFFISFFCFAALLILAPIFHKSIFSRRSHLPGSATRRRPASIYVEEGSSSHLLIPAIFFRTILSSMVRETKTVLYTSPSSKIGGGRLSLGCCVTAGSFRIRQPPPYIQRAGISPHVSLSFVTPSKKKQRTASLSSPFSFPVQQATTIFSRGHQRKTRRRLISSCNSRPAHSHIRIGKRQVLLSFIQKRGNTPGDVYAL